MKLLKFLFLLPVRILAAPVVLALTLFTWVCTGLVYVSGLALGLVSMVLALLGVAVSITYSPQNGITLLVLAFLVFIRHYLKQHSWVGDRFPSLGRIRCIQFPVVQFLKLGAGHTDGCVLRQ